MPRTRLLWVLPIVAAVLFVVSSGAAARTVTTSSSEISADLTIGTHGAVFTMTNAPSGNAIVGYVIGPGGSLIPAGQFSTHGKGTGVSLADSGSVALTADHQYLLGVNAGSNTISVFHVNSPSGGGPLLTFIDAVSSHGVLPVSIAIHGPFVYVLNAGTSLVPGNIFGFYRADHGVIFPLPGSSRPLSTSASTAPAQISFDPSGSVLVVTEKNTSVLDTYTVDYRGYASAPTVTASNGYTPYGFAFGRDGSLIVSDAASGALTSYIVSSSGTLTVKTPALSDGQAAPCWVATVDGGRFAFTSNAHGSTISTYAVGPGGALTLLVAVAASTGPADTDMAVGGAHGQLLFVYDAGAGEIQEFGVGSGASLTLQYDVFGLPATAEGLAAF
ncbi:MAG: beta-propeller fold lactonase family protein [Thermoplasmata archaeon]|jgi:6-phosphogluconolactonase